MKKIIKKVKFDIIDNIEEILPEVHKVNINTNCCFRFTFSSIDLDYDDGSVEYIYSYGCWGESEDMIISSEQINELISQGFSGNLYIDSDKANIKLKELMDERNKNRIKMKEEEEKKKYEELKAKYGD